MERELDFLFYESELGDMGNIIGRYYFSILLLINSLSFNYPS